jgi:hypothetical protein
VLAEDPSAKVLFQANVTSNASTVANVTAKANTSANATSEVWIQPTPAGHQDAKKQGPHNLVAKLHNFDVKTQIHEQDKQVAFEKKALQQQLKNTTTEEVKAPSNATKVVTYKTATESKKITLNQTNIDLKAKEILASTKIHVNDTKVNAEAKKLN